mgnify:CR=1 FL=1
MDQFRGYTVAGMFLVNFIGSFVVIPAIFKHHKVYCSYADTIMPQFFFAVGYAYRLTYLRRREKYGVTAAWRHSISRNLGLLLVGLIMYHLDGGVESWADLKNLGLSGFLSHSFRSSIFQTLVHIAITSLWILPVIGASPLVRILFMTVSGLAHLGLSQMFYYQWALSNGAIDGGPLGFMTWTIPTLVGSLVYDGMVNRGPRRTLNLAVPWALVLMVGGYGLSCLTAVRHSLTSGAGSWLAAPPFFPPIHPQDIWTMSQKTGSLSYLVFSAGFSLAVYALFIVLSDLGRFQLGLFRTLGQNALAGYILHGWVKEPISPFVPRDAPLGYVLSAFLVFFLLTWFIMKYLEKRGLYLRL